MPAAEAGLVHLGQAYAIISAQGSWKALASRGGTFIVQVDVNEERIYCSLRQGLSAPPATLGQPMGFAPSELNVMQGLVVSMGDWRALYAS